MIASLPMYELAAVRDATDRWWAGLARHMRAARVADVPERLERDPAPAWTDPRLLFSQTCGYPVTHALAGRVAPLCTPAYDAPGCSGARYASALLVRAESDAAALADLRGGVCAINAPDSHSGYNVLRRMLSALAHGGAFFGKVIETGSHVASLAAVANGEADLCAVDTVTHALLARHGPDRLAGTRVLTYSPQAPGLPYVAGRAVDADRRACMRGAVHAALADPALAEARDALLIAGAEDLPLSAYDEIVAMEEEAAAMGYPVLR